MGGHRGFETGERSSTSRNGSVTVHVGNHRGYDGIRVWSGLYIGEGRSMHVGESNQAFFSLVVQLGYKLFGDLLRARLVHRLPSS